MTYSRKLNTFWFGLLIVLLAAGVVLSVGLYRALADSGAASDPFVAAEGTGAPPSGAIPDGEYLDITADSAHAAIARLDPALRAALEAATTAAADSGVTIGISSGWRSQEYQEYLLSEKIDEIGATEAKRLVADPGASHHVTGDAVDIGPMSATDWLAQRGAEFGLCQVYANESWHYELATTPGGSCPAMKSDATET